MKKNLPIYIKDLIKKFPDILSGRKNYILQNERVLKNLKISQEYKKKIKT